MILLEHNLEVFLQTATYQSIPAEYGDERGTRIGRLVDASIKPAGLSCTRDNLDALTPNPSRDYLYALKMGESEKFLRFGEMRDQFRLDCAAKIEKLKNHMLTDIRCLQNSMLAAYSTDLCSILCDQLIMRHIQSTSLS